MVFWGILIIIVILFCLTRQDYSAYSSYIPTAQSAVLPVQLSLIQDKLYLVNGNTDVVSVVDTQTDQLKMMLPFR
ncbi:hypothetical protein COC69_26185 [Bacillus cereus]|uniref:Uncharacterized protein n=1 Tax=Bacillus cereus TaxID=1396 RepID=A0A9X7CIQ7_BACCE|nr:hypothetical protein [Bacillus cereus]PGS69039.1 hypothetical protein COC69_26185 [Bacillus cereus]